MITDWELWACANHYVKIHGEEAPIVVALRIDELLARDEHDGAEIFLVIMQRVEVLLNLPAGSVIIN